MSSISSSASSTSKDSILKPEEDRLFQEKYTPIYCQLRCKAVEPEEVCQVITSVVRKNIPYEEAKTNYFKDLFHHIERKAIFLSEKSIYTSPHLDKLYEKFPEVKKCLSLAREQLGINFFNGIDVLCNKVFSLLISAFEVKPKWTLTEFGEENSIDYQEYFIKHIILSVSNIFSTLFIDFNISEKEKEVLTHYLDLLIANLGKESPSQLLKKLKEYLEFLFSLDELTLPYLFIPFSNLQECTPIEKTKLTIEEGLTQLKVILFSLKVFKEIKPLKKDNRKDKTALEAFRRASTLQHTKLANALLQVSKETHLLFESVNKIKTLQTEDILAQTYDIINRLTFLQKHYFEIYDIINLNKLRDLSKIDYLQPLLFISKRLDKHHLRMSRHLSDALISFWKIYTSLYEELVNMRPTFGNIFPSYRHIRLLDLFLHQILDNCFALCKLKESQEQEIMIELATFNANSIQLFKEIDGYLSTITLEKFNTKKTVIDYVQLMEQFSYVEASFSNLSLLLKKCPNALKFLKEITKIIDSFRPLFSNTLLSLNFCLLGLKKPVGNSEELNSSDVAYFQRLFDNFELVADNANYTTNLLLARNIDKLEKLTNLNQLEKIKVKQLISECICYLRLDNLYNLRLGKLIASQSSLREKISEFVNYLSTFEVATHRSSFRNFCSEILENLGDFSESANEVKAFCAEWLVAMEESSIIHHNNFVYPARPLIQWVADKSLFQQDSMSNKITPVKKKKKKKAKAIKEKSNNSIATSFVKLTSPIAASVNRVLPSTPFQIRALENAIERKELNSLSFKNLSIYLVGLREILLNKNIEQAPHGYILAALKYEALIYERFFSDSLIQKGALNKKTHDLVTLFESHSICYPENVTLLNQDRISFLSRMVDRYSRYPSHRTVEMDTMLTELTTHAKEHPIESLLDPLKQSLENLSNLMVKVFPDRSTKLILRPDSPESSSSSTCEEKKEVTTLNPTSLNSLKQALDSLKKIVQSLHLLVFKQLFVKQVHPKELQLQKEARQNVIKEGLSNLVEYLNIFSDLLSKNDWECRTYVDTDLCFMYMSLCLEQAEKILLAFENKPDPNKATQHILFQEKIIQSKSRVYKHEHLVDQFLSDLKSTLPKDFISAKEQLVVTELSKVIGYHSRYLAGLTDTVADVMNEMLDLSNRRWKAIQNEQEITLKTIGLKINAVIHTKIYPRLEAALNLSNRLLGVFLNQMKMLASE